MNNEFMPFPSLTMAVKIKSGKRFYPEKNFNEVSVTG